MKKVIIMLLAWAVVCLLSLPQTTEKDSPVPTELSTVASTSTAEVASDIFSKLP